MLESHSSLNVSTVPKPVPVGETMPSRKIIRSWLTDLAGRSTLRALTLLIVDYIMLFVLLGAAMALSNGWFRLMAGLVAGFWIGRLFVLGHDACHQSFTSNRKLNKILGRIAFLPSLSAYSLWDVGHNVIHHGFTNLKGTDFVWLPKTIEEYQALSPTGKILERIYRSGWGSSVYYIYEIWWTKMFFPNKKNTPGNRKSFFWDNVLVSAFAALWLLIIMLVASACDVNIFAAIFSAFVIPFVFWNGMIGWVVYTQHTHTKIAWYEDKKEWIAAQPFVTTTVHLTFKRSFGAMVHHIMEHTAHHLDMTIPLYQLKAAQERLEQLLPERIVIQEFSWKWYFETANKCKLYDYKAHCWTDFGGKRTSEPVFVKA